MTVPKEQFCDLHRVGDGYEAVYISATGGWANVRTWDKFSVEHIAFPELPSQMLTRVWAPTNRESYRQDININYTNATPTHEDIHLYLMVLFQCKTVSIVKALFSNKITTSTVANLSIVRIFIRDQHRRFHIFNSEIWNDPYDWTIQELLDWYCKLAIVWEEDRRELR
jgi:hypothetical protein